MLWSGSGMTPSAGLTLTLPVGWRGTLGPDGESFVMEAESGDGYLFVTGDQNGRCSG